MASIDIMQEVPFIDKTCMASRHTYYATGENNHVHEDDLLHKAGEAVTDVGDLLQKVD